MAKRHADALYINQGAVNATAVSRSLAEATKACLAEGKDTMGVRQDPAVRLICHQLAFLCNLPVSIPDYSAVVAECERLKDLP